MAAKDTRISILDEYKESTILKKFQVQKAANLYNNRTVALFTDIDNTYINIEKPNTEQCEKLSEEEITELTIQNNRNSIAATDALTDWLFEHSIPIIGVTGRDLENVRSGQPGGTDYDVEHLPMFDIVAASVGTRVWVLQKSGDYLRDEEFVELIEQRIRFERKSIYEICRQVREAFIKTNSGHLTFQERDTEENVELYKRDPHALEHHLTDRLHPQSTKISLNYLGKKSGLSTLEKMFKATFKDKGYPYIRVVTSFDAYHGKEVSYNIDIVPVTKRDSINYLTKKFNCIGLFGGDSGNDIDAIVGAGHAGFAVANRTIELDEFLTNNVLGYDETLNAFQTVHIKYKNTLVKRLLYIDYEKQNKRQTSLNKAVIKFTSYLKNLKDMNLYHVHY